MPEGEPDEIGLGPNGKRLRHATHRVVALDETEWPDKV